jgi:phosphatidylglycerophosphatase A
MVVALAGVPLTTLNTTAGFIAFRVFDVFKPFPARFLDSRAPGGWGIVLDDVVAGVYSNFLLRALSIIFLQEASARAG